MDEQLRKNLLIVEIRVLLAKIASVSGIDITSFNTSGQTLEEQSFDDLNVILRELTRLARTPG